MKKFRILLATLAFLFAFGAAFALGPSYDGSNSDNNIILVKGQDAGCPIGFVDSSCKIVFTGHICTFTVVLNTYLAVSADETNCEFATVLRIPDY